MICRPHIITQKTAKPFWAYWGNNLVLFEIPLTPKIQSVFLYYIWVNKWRGVGASLIWLLGRGGTLFMDAVWPQTMSGENEIGKQTRNHNADTDRAD